MVEKPQNLMAAICTTPSPLHPCPTVNLHMLLSACSFLKPRVTPCLSAEKPSEFTNTPPPLQPRSQATSIQSTLQVSLSFYTFSPPTMSTYCEPATVARAGGAEPTHPCVPLHVIPARVTWNHMESGPPASSFRVSALTSALSSDLPLF